MIFPVKFHLEVEQFFNFVQYFSTSIFPTLNSPTFQYFQLCFPTGAWTCSYPLTWIAFEYLHFNAWTATKVTIWPVTIMWQMWHKRSVVILKVLACSVSGWLKPDWLNAWIFLEYSRFYKLLIIKMETKRSDFVQFEPFSKPCTKCNKIIGYNGKEVCKVSSFLFSFKATIRSKIWKFFSRKTNQSYRSRIPSG